MSILKRISALVISAAMMCAGTNAVYAENNSGGDTVNIKVDGSTANTNENFLYRGQGMISCNGSSRLLIDYKEKNPDSYNQILQYMYGKNGLKFTHFKVEMGSDVNTSSGTEPTTMRYEDEKADVTRGAGFQLAADIKKINPDVTLDMLWWSEPRWVTDAKDVYAARYKWYKQTLDAAYETYGLVFDYVSANRNERTVDNDWIIYLSKALKSEKDCPYDYSKIKIVAADENTTWKIAHDMLKNEELRDAVDVIGTHYTSYADKDAKKLAEEYGKELWFSEGSSPMTYAQSVYRYDEGNSGLTGLNGVFDVANRMITMVSGGYMTLYEYQPAVAGYYDGVTYCQKQLINANTPWNGYYTLDSGYFMNLHFSQFMDKGWSFIFDACYSDAKAGGDGHALVDAKYSYIIACSKDGDYSTIITNTTSEPITYNFEVTNLAKADNEVYVWETRGPDEGQEYNANYFKKISTVTPQNGKYSVTIKPYSMITVSTLNISEPEFDVPQESSNTLLSLPYTDDFGYSDEFLASRGNAPLYTTDEGGAFEVADKDGEKVLMQKITADIKAEEWGGTPNPTTNFGDDRWYNYSISADIMTDGEGSYAGVGLRYSLADSGKSGYSVTLNENGTWILFGDKRKIDTGEISGFDATKWHNIKISALYNAITVYADDVKITEFKAENAGFGSGRAALYSSYNNCLFDNVKVEATDTVQPYVNKYDNLDAIFTYSEDGWEHNTMDSFKNFRRTLSRGTEGASMTVDFEGTGIVLTGMQSGEGTINVSVDNKSIKEGYELSKTANRQAFIVINGLEQGKHTLKLAVTGGMCSIDAAQVLYDYAAVKPTTEETVSSSAEEVNSSVVESSEPAESSNTDNSSSSDSAESTSADNGENSFPVVPVAVGAAVAAVAVGVGVAIAKTKKKKD